ncbi:zinc ABC transporter solute-binding protein [Alphaproteobacteria bacterium GH1-50]|uniref:Zinc ABC transporter solute-binding protein n=2 Tax=Kangsaoukella pontilimi TaxID=2691042 RepID=A0A7C9IQU0_9RHOB|nr:zinc ABC transporter solute-binding protein [Kangsaoukella pontilimi]
MAWRTDRRGVLLGLGASALVLGGMSAPARASGVLDVVATTGMIADVARRIGGDAVTVKALMGPGVDPHAYRQTRSDIVALARADLVLWNGLYLEAQMEDFMADLAGRTRVVPVAEAMPSDLRIAHDDYADRKDPHIWMDPALWRYAIEATRDAMVAAAPEHAEAFKANTAEYLTEVSTLADYATGVLSSVPESARVLITAHDAFNYFGRAYGYEVVGIQGISTESEAGLARMGELVDMLVERRIGAVFVESSVSDRSVKALIEGAAARGHEVRIGGELFSDAMGAPGTYEGTYIGMIDHNATLIASALGGDAPLRGLNGRLSAGS